MHRCQLPLVFLVSLFGGQCVEQVRKLDAAAHELVGVFVLQALADEQTVVGVKQEANRVAGADGATHQGLNRT